jgi:ADP-heptose:LPS heptosyltransferase
VLYLPHRDLYPRIGTPGSNPDHKHDFHPEDIVAHMRAIGGWDLLVNETRDQRTEYSFLQVFRKREDAEQVMAYRHQPEGPRACVVRYGGFGDQIQASNILPELKRQGYHVTFNTTPAGQEILRLDPHIDEWIIQDRDQVPNHELWEYWSAWEGRFDRYINLSSSVEDTLLPKPGTPAHMWPHALRHKTLNVNYLERTADIADLPYKSEAKFYPSKEEEARAFALLGADDRQHRAFNIMWCLSGSSPHKFYPWQDVVIEQILAEMPEARLILSGDMACKILEAGWEKNDRILCTSGEMGIRDTLTLAQYVDVVVGPETGVLNAVGFNAMVHKLVLLSHSSAENLSKHWENATALFSKNTPCYPCHQLHITMRYCMQHAASGAAMCQVDIQPHDVYADLQWQYALWSTRKAGVLA